ncbi:MAG: hypothetical protein KBE04_03920 [Phycisphaerae bacterium]|nr:hypothetical protein [Phycisphaerae bacterium]
MTERQILEEILRVLETHGLEVRHEGLGGSSGGLCTIHGRAVLFLDDQAPVEDQLDLCAKAVRKVVDLETCYLKPQVRQAMEDRGG